MIDETKIRTRKLLGQSNFPRKEHLSPLVAEEFVADILAYLASRPDDLIRFFELSGLTPHSLRKVATTPDFAGSLLDYLCGDERLLCGFAAARGVDPANIDATRRRFTGSFEGDGG